jgi:hypothetical protein
LLLLGLGMCVPILAWFTWGAVEREPCVKEHHYQDREWHCPLLLAWQA